MTLMRLKRTVAFTKQASADLRRLRESDQAAVLHNVAQVANDTNPYTRLRKLKNDAGWNMPVGRYRVWITVETPGEIIVTRIARRPDAYRRGS